MVSRLCSIPRQKAAHSCLNVSFLQAVTVCEVIYLITALLWAVVDPHGDGVNLSPPERRGGGPALATSDPVGEVVHLLLQLKGGLLQRGEEVPALHVEAAALAAVGEHGAAARLADSEARAVLPTRVPSRGLDRRAPALVVEAAQDTPAALALAAEQAGEGALELLAGAGVDDGVDAAVEVAQPEDDFEHDLRGLQLGEQGACDWIETMMRLKTRTTLIINTFCSRVLIHCYHDNPALFPQCSDFRK